MNQFRASILLTAAITLIGCQKEAVIQESMLPDWVTSPYIEGGIASTECVNYSGDMSMDKAQASALGRAELAKQLGIKVKAMDKSYKRRVKSAAGDTSGGTFESVSKQVAAQHLSGSAVRKANIVKVDGVSQFCAMVAIGPSTTQTLFKELVSQSGASVTPQDESALFEEFKSSKGQEALESETSSM